MRYLLVGVLILAAALGLSLYINMSSLNREALLENSPVPEKREFLLSEEISACEDFHQYVCHEVEESFELPEDRSIWVFSFNDNSERLLSAKKTFFRRLLEGYDPKGPRIGQVKNFYLACMNEEASAKDERALVDSTIDKMSEVASLSQFQELIAKNIASPETSFVVFEPTADQNNPEWNDVLLIGSVLTLPDPTYYFQEAVVSDLESLMTEFFRAISLAEPRKRAKQVMDYEKAMARNYPKASEIRELLVQNTYKAREAFLKQYPNLQLESLFDRIPENIRIRDFAPKTLEYLNGSLSGGDLEALKNVYLFHSLYDFLDDAYPDFQKKVTQFKSKHLGAPPKRPERDERCTRLAMEMFPHELDEYLTPILFPNFPRERVESLVKRVRQALLADLNDNQWLSNSAKKAAVEKMTHARLFLVQPESEGEWSFNIPSEYSVDHPIENFFSLRRAQIEKSIEELSSIRPRERWEMGPLVLNAYYSPPDNHFVLLQGILQPPFFDASASDIENLGAIGAVIGHELGHGIDDKGASYDADGRLNRWMTEKDLAEFSERAELFVERFNSIGHDGKLTLGENIGDHMGLRAAYRAAFRGSSKDHSAAEKRNFFKAYARMWCMKARPEFEQMLLKTDPHSLGRERINQQVNNLDGFYEAFSCQPGDGMYLEPSKRIRVW